MHNEDSRDVHDDILAYRHIARQQRGEQTSATIKLLLETVSSAWSVPKSYLEDNWGDPLSCQLTESSLRVDICTADCEDRT
jgi:hypothetical protein